MRMGFRGLILALTVAFVANASGAVSRSRQSFPYSRTVWRVGSGLPEDTVQSIAQSPNGALWLGTTGGLAVFDGSRLQSYDNAKAQVISNSYFVLTRDHSGTIWAGTEGGGLLAISASGDTRIYSFASGLSDGFVRAVFEDSHHRLWVGTDGGLFVKDGDRFKRWESNSNADPHLAVHSIAEDQLHRVWVGGSRLFAIDPQGNEQSYVLPGKDSQSRVKCIRQTADGIVWVGTVGGLDRLRDGKFEPVPGINSTVRTILQSSDGVVWIGTIGSGLWQIRGDRTLQVTPESLLPSQTVLTIFEDDQQQIWIGTQAGLVRLNKTAVSLVPLPEAGDPDFETISGDSRGTIWVAAQKAYAIQDEVAHPIDPLKGEHAKARNVFRDRDGNVWIGTDGNGVYEISTDGSRKHVSAPEELTNNFVRGFLQTHDGSIWVACDEGVNVLTAHSWRKITEANGLVYFSIRSLYQDREGSVWIGTDRGLSLWKDGRFLHNAVTDALANEKVWSVLQDKSGSMWFGTRDHGLFGLTSHGLVHWTISAGLPSNSIFQLLEDLNQRVWISGPNSIASIEEAALNMPDIGPTHPPGIRVYSMPFGGDGGQLYGGRQPSGYLAPDDTVWFPTTRGVAHVRASDTAYSPAPHSVLTSVNEDGRAVAIADGKLTVPAHVSRVEFDFSAIFLQPQSGLRFRYRLEPFDKDWTLVSVNRIATYTNLPAKNYRFRVLAFDLANPDRTSEVDVQVTKEPLFYQTWWFYTLSVCVVGGVVWIAYKLRVRRVQQQFKAVMEERGRLAREMHDTVVQGCVGVSTLLEAVTVTPVEDGPAREHLLTLAREQAQSTIRDAREVVWDMRHEDESEVDLIASLNSLADQTVRGTRSKIDFQSNLVKLSLRASASHELVMLVGEAINNAAQHSGSDSISVAVSKRDERLYLTVEDKGAGFEVASLRTSEKHYGILGMRERAERLGGNLTLTSIPNQGTQIQVTLPLRSLRKSVWKSCRHHV